MDYVKEAMRTAQNRFYGQNVGRTTLVMVLSRFVQKAQYIDTLKRVLFYGAETGYENPPVTNVNTLVTNETDQYYLHAVLGLITEVGEIAENMLARFQSGNTDKVNLVEETGDVKWYLAMLCDKVSGVPWDADEILNIQKLRRRFPDKFTEEDALTRDLFAEREILEGKE